MKEHAEKEERVTFFLVVVAAAVAVAATTATAMTAATTTVAAAAAAVVVVALQRLRWPWWRVCRCRGLRVVLMVRVRCMGRLLGRCFLTG